MARGEDQSLNRIFRLGHGGWVNDWWGFTWMILAETRGLLTPENRAAAWRKYDEKLMAETNVVAVIRGRAAP
jgi:hypothetical protein